MKYYRIQEKYNERNGNWNTTYTSVRNPIFMDPDTAFIWCYGHAKMYHTDRCVVDVDNQYDPDRTIRIDTHKEYRETKDNIELRVIEIDMIEEIKTSFFIRNYPKKVVDCDVTEIIPGYFRVDVCAESDTGRSIDTYTYSCLEDEYYPAEESDVGKLAYLY